MSIIDDTCVGQAPELGADTGRGGDSKRGAGKKKAPVEDQGLKSLIAVITLRRLLREEKQGAVAQTTAQKQCYH